MRGASACAVEKFQAELAKRILKWPKHFSNTAAITPLELATCRVLELATCRVLELATCRVLELATCRVLERKLVCLKRVEGGDVGGPS